MSFPECLFLGTAITFVIIMMLDLGLSLCLSNSNNLYLLTLYGSCLNKKIDFNIIFPSEFSSKFFNEHLTIAYFLLFTSLPSQTFPSPTPPFPSTRPLIILKQFVVNTQSSYRKNILLSTKFAMVNHYSYHETSACVPFAFRYHSDLNWIILISSSFDVTWRSYIYVV